MATKKTVEFTAKNVKAFTGWLKRFSTIDNSLLLEIDQQKSIFVAKTYNEERSVVKMSSIKFDEAGLAATTNKDSKRIKVGIFNIPRLIKIIDQFNDVEFTITIEYQEMINDTETQYAGEKILLKNKILKMNVDCTSLNIFKYIPDQLFVDSIATIKTIGSFELNKETLEKINSLNSLDNDHRFMQIIFKEGEIKISGKSYERILDITKDVKDAELSIFKDQFGTLDIENYDVNLGEDRLVFLSKDSDTTTVISKAEDSES
jgi:hypothetical protein